ncbi:MAG: hypothetical protein ACREJ2_02160 [Planctomycetota bacterium]
MIPGGQTTQINWQTLCRLAGAHLNRLYTEQDSLTYETLLQSMNLPDTPLIRDLAEQAGFDVAGGLSRQEENRIHRALRKGITEPRAVAEATGIAMGKIERHLARIGAPYGGGGYGAAPWPKATDGVAETDGEAFSPRRISARGQISFSGKLYSVGVQYGHSVCWVRAEPDSLLIRFPNEQSLQIRR